VSDIAALSLLGTAGLCPVVGSLTRFAANAGGDLAAASRAASVARQRRRRRPLLLAEGANKVGKHLLGTEARPPAELAVCPLG
jgi:hypothetical protein